MTELRESVSFRPVTEDDLPFLEQLYGSTREAELALVPWSEAEKARFVAFQFNAQHTHYQDHFPDADYHVIELGGQTIGRLYVDRRPDELRLMDIALIPAQRGRGLGTCLLGELLAEADAAGLPVCLHVEANNPAMRLYQRLGFEFVEDQGIYQFMARPPGATTGDAAER